MLVCGVRKFLNLLFIFLFSFSLLAKVGCENNYVSTSEVETVYKQEIQYQRVSSKHLKQGQLKADLIDDRDVVFIGLNMKGHMYIVADGYRYDYKGRSFFKSAAARKNNNLLTRGIVIKLDDYTGEIAAGVEEFFAKNEGAKAISCIKGSCRAVSESGVVNFNDNGMSSLLPSNFLKNYIVNGVEGSELFVLGDKSLSHITQHLRSRTNEELYQFSLHGFLYSGLVLTPVAVAIAKMF